jgi:hypothetical protein
MRNQLFGRQDPAMKYPHANLHFSQLTVPDMSASNVTF